MNTKKTTTPKPAKEFAAPLPEIGTNQFITSPHADKIFTALSKAQGEVKKAVQTKRASDDQRRETWNYAGLDDVMDAIQEARGNNGLAVVERFPAGKSALHVFLVHSSGQWIDYGAYALGEYKTQNEKTAAVTIARRNVMKCIFNVADKVDDTDARGEGNRSLATNDNIDAPLADDAGPRSLTDKEKREAYQDAKSEWHIEPTITGDGRIDFDSFAGDYEAMLDKVKTMSDLGMLSKANNKTLNALMADRPDLYQQLMKAVDPIAQKLL